jgi:superfamily II DNA/RNA helicase
MKIIKKKLKQLQIKIQLVINKKYISFQFFFEDIYLNKIEIAKKVWSDLYVSENIIRSLVEQKFFDPTPIQRLSLPAAIRDGLDIIGAAETVISLYFLL